MGYKKRWNEEDISEDESKQTKSLSQCWTSQQTNIRRLAENEDFKGLHHRHTQIHSFQPKVIVTLTSHTRTEHNEQNISKDMKYQMQNSVCSHDETLH